MLLQTLFPLLARYALAIDVIANSDNTVTVTIVPRNANGAATDNKSSLQPISLTGSAAEIDAELAKGENGALGQLILARRSIADQLAQQAADAENAKKAAAEAAKKATASRAATKAPAKAPAPAAASNPEPNLDQDDDPAPVGDPAEPASLWA